MANADPFREVRDLLDAGRQTDHGLDAVIQAYKERARSKITMIIVWAYVIGLGLIMLYFMIWGFTYGVDVKDSIIEILKIGLLPIMTLVIGYYVGSSR